MEAIGRIARSLAKRSPRSDRRHLPLSPCGIVLLCGLVLTIDPAFAAGTPAGIVIDNTATVTFEVDDVPGEASGTGSFQVDEIIDVIVVWQDGADVQTASPDTDRALTFLVTNTGNGIESFSLRADNNLSDTDDFDPDSARIFLDSDANGLFDGPATDSEYVPGNNDPQLDANGSDSITVFITNNIPGGLETGVAGNSQLLAVSTTDGAAGSAPGTGFPGLGDGGVEAVAGNNRADGAASGRYQIGVVASPVALTKTTIVVANDRGCDTPPCAPRPGATIRYTIEADVTQVPVNDLLITDLIPANTRYVANSISLDAAQQTDATDGDPGSFVSDTVNVSLGDVTAVATYAITFDVTID